MTNLQRIIFYLISIIHFIANYSLQRETETIQVRIEAYKSKISILNKNLLWQHIFTVINGLNWSILKTNNIDLEILQKESVSI